MDRVEGASQEGLDYVFPHFCGILVTSLAWFAVYCLYKRYHGGEFLRLVWFRATLISRRADIFSNIAPLADLDLFGRDSVSAEPPAVYPEVMLPGLLSGWMWAAGQTGWFIANDNLSLVVTFPLIVIGACCLPLSCVVGPRC